MRIDEWMQSRAEPGSIANAARRMIKRDVKYREFERLARGIYFLEATFRNGCDLGKAAQATGVSAMTVRRALRSIGIPSSEIADIAKFMEGSSNAGTAD
jgi:hypothetical protein